MNEWSYFCANVGNQSWQVWVSLRGKTKMVESKMVWIQVGRIQDGCYHQVESEWMSEVFFVKMNPRWQNSRWLPSSSWVRMNDFEFELVGVRVRVEWECFWVNLREDNKVSESKMAVSESNMAEFKMAAIIKLSQNEWVKFFCANGGNQSWQVWVSLRKQTKMDESKMAKFKMAVFKMAAII